MQQRRGRLDRQIDQMKGMQGGDRQSEMISSVMKDSKINIEVDGEIM